MKRIQRRWALAALLTSVPVVALVQAEQKTGERFAYGEANFNAFVKDSYQVLPGQTQAFVTWLEAAYANTPNLQLPGAVTLEAALKARRTALAALRDTAAKAKLERDTGAWLHRMVKVLIPKFSLDRGFEFVNTVRLGERQCLLQSVLISSLAQAMGMDAGAAMVWRNEKGQTSNLGHVVSVFKLANGLDVLVDASDKDPFMRHQGLFMRDQTANDWRFLEPVFTADASISAYKRTLDGANLKPDQVRGLSTAYLRSQFYYYRGERTPKGFMGPSTPEGLRSSAAFLETAQRFEPNNPLAVYVLGLVYRKLGRTEAKAQLERGLALYQRYGFVPDGPRNAVSSQ